jgi:dihydrofolate synthase / folylpolyglutamate synthase
MPDHAHSSAPAVQTQLDRLWALSPGRDVLGLERITELCARLGNPQAQLPPVFHVAGTNGKGSTCAFLRAAIEAAGLACHVYSSPHLVRFNERIRIAGQLIDDDLLAALLSEVLDVAEGLNASFFEVTTAAAFLAFARTPADACIIEVGLGGRLDATNIIAAPAICGIASLGIDHEGFLLAPEEGLPEMADQDRIAFEKAGIAKEGVGLVCQKYAPSMLQAIVGQAMAHGAKLLDRGECWDAVIYEGRLHYRDGAGKLSLPLPRMAGPHQAENAALAIAMLRHQKAIAITESALASAMTWARWPGRMQLLSDGPLTALVPGADIWLDGGHNVDGGRAIAAHFEGEKRRIHLITGMLANKHPSAIIAPLLDKLASITVLPVPGHEHHGVAAFQINGAPLAVPANDVEQALKMVSINPASEIILIAGTLYLAGGVLQLNDEIPA